MSRRVGHSRPVPVWTIHLLAVVAVIATALGSGGLLAQPVGAHEGLVASAAGYATDTQTSDTRRAPATGGQSFYRYVSPEELAAIQETGYLRGGRPGDTFWTSDEYTSAAEAQDKLALPVTPQLRVRFLIVNTPTLTRDGSVVEPAFGGAGGGHEWASPDPVQVEIVDVQPLT